MLLKYFFGIPGRRFATKKNPKNNLTKIYYFFPGVYYLITLCGSVMLRIMVINQSMEIIHWNVCYVDISWLILRIQERIRRVIL